VNATSPVESEGIPYELETYRQLGVVPEDPSVQDNGAVLLPKEQETDSLCLVLVVSD